MQSSIQQPAAVNFRKLGKVWRAFFFAVFAYFPFLLSHAEPARVLQTAQAGVNAQIEVLGDAFAGLQGISSAQSRVLVYRLPQSGSLPGATGVFVDGQYLTSLVVGGYSQLCLEPGALELWARQVAVGLQANHPYDSATVVNLAGGQTVYLRVEDVAGRAALSPVQPQQALRELLPLRLQVHTVSRVTKSQACNLDGTTDPAPQLAIAPAAQTPAAPVRLPQGLSSRDDVQFKFGQSTVRGVTNAGKASLDRLIQKIQTEYSQVDSIRLIGHADPLGRKAANERLAWQRANTLSQYLRNSIPVPADFVVEARGSREPVTTCALQGPTTTLVRCNQPNRRVAIEVVGLPR